MTTAPQPSSLAALIHPLWAWLMGVRRRFVSVRWNPVPRRSRAGEARPEGQKRTPPVRLAGRRGWIVQELGYKGAHCKAQLELLLDLPEMRAVIDAAPGFGRVLRPMCWMLGISRDRATSAAELSAATPVARRRERARPGKMQPIVVLHPPAEPVARLTLAEAWGFAKIR